jgi:hypothetical protein
MWQMRDPGPSIDQPRMPASLPVSEAIGRCTGGGLEGKIPREVSEDIYTCVED